jgi:hypothetical protein
MEDKSNVTARENRWSSTMKPRSPRHWSNLANNKSQIEPPQRPMKRLSINCEGQIDPHDYEMKNDADPISHHDFRWEDCLCDKPNNKSQIEPPQRPMKRLSVSCEGRVDPPHCSMKNDVDLISRGEFRWKDCLRVKPSVLIQPIRRGSVGILVDDIQDVHQSKSHFSQSHQTPKIQAAMSA